MSERLPEIILGVVRDDEGRVLIIQRIKKERGLGDVILSWTLPGGKIDPDETKEEAVRREVLEETGYQVEPKALISERRHPQFPVYVFYFACNLEPGQTPQEPSEEEVRSVEWVEPARLGDYFTTDFNQDVAKYLSL